MKESQQPLRRRYYAKFISGYIFSPQPTIQKGVIDDIINEIDGFNVSMVTASQKWNHWIAILDIKTCISCRRLHGQVFPVDERPLDEPPLHERCRCEVRRMRAIVSGYATRNGRDGADYCLKENGILPEYYISKATAKELGWRGISGNLAEVAPGKMIGGDIYRNRSGHLPKANGRIWYEADINYTHGYRTWQRILYSNDGLIFVTYDHYQTFSEII